MSRRAPHPFRYPGAKQRLLGALRPALFPRLAAAGYFVDGFVGGGSVLVDVAMHHPGLRLHCNDKDTGIAAFWRLVAAGGRELAALAEHLHQPVTLDRFYQLQNSAPADDVGAAYRALFLNRTTFGGITTAGPIGGRSQASAYAVDCRYDATKLCRDIDDLAQLMSGRLTVTGDDVTAVLHRHGGGGVLYLDPPYYEKGAQLYAVAMTPTEHAHLAAELHKLSDWVLSYDDCIPIRDLYDWATIEEVHARYSMDSTKPKREQRKELLIYVTR